MSLAITIGVLLVGCTGPDLSPVPTTAAAPYACPGVPLDSAELVAGEPLEINVISDDGWGHETGQFLCNLRGEHTVVRVQEMSVTMSAFGPTEESVLGSMAASSARDPLDLDAPGTGHVWGDTSAGWVCNGRSIIVEALGDPVDGRDREADVTNLLASMLPWACDGKDVPEATTEG